MVQLSDSNSRRAAGTKSGIGKGSVSTRASAGKSFHGCLGRTVALKALPDDLASDPEHLERFEREARVLASLSHPNIAAIYGLEESEGRRYLVLEHIEGETLADRIARGPLPLQETLDICIQIASGVETAHDAGVVHRDLKPGNV